jgi:IclR family mhp operon transcriptional activator
MLHGVDELARFRFFHDGQLTVGQSNALARSQQSEDRLATERKRALSLLAAIRKQGFAERDPMVEPRSSGTIALPIIVNARVLATVGMTYFTSALDRTEIIQRYVPLVKGLADNIAASVSSLQE